MSRKIVPTQGKIRLVAIIGLAVLILATGAQSSQETSSQAQNDTAQKNESTNHDLVEHGKYLVHHVAMCVKCHTPRDRNGDLLETQLLEGASIPVKRPYPNQEWSLKAPHLAGLPGGWSEQSLAEFLQTGKTPTGYTIDPPMPPFRMNQKDAKAVAAYLQSMNANR